MLLAIISDGRVISILTLPLFYLFIVLKTVPTTKPEHTKQTFPYIHQATSITTNQTLHISHLSSNTSRQPNQNNRSNLSVLNKHAKPVLRHKSSTVLFHSATPNLTTKTRYHFNHFNIINQEPS